MILAHHGLSATEAELGAKVTLEDSGLDPDAAVKLIRDHGVEANTTQLDFDEVRRLVETAQFPIILVDRTFLDNEFVVHAVIPVRFTRRFVVMLDPHRGERRISIARFEKAMRRVGGWAVVAG
jgi:ABC-type bacteriocin/lantibiotic exporter with double-glycine peptidase domain